MNLAADEMSSVFMQAAKTFQAAFMENSERFANLISEEVLRKDYHINENPWIANYVIDINRVELDDMLPGNPKYAHTARIYFFQKQYYCEKLIRNGRIIDVSLAEMQNVLRNLYRKGIGVRLSPHSIYVWNGCVKFSILYPSSVASKEAVYNYYVERLAKLYYRNPEEIKEVLKCELF